MLVRGRVRGTLLMADIIWRVSALTLLEACSVGIVEKLEGFLWVQG
jgi:hypothetical protein